MRLFLIPISTRRTLVFGQRLNKVTAAQPSLADKASAYTTIHPQRGLLRCAGADNTFRKAANLWMKWESGDKGWQKWITRNGNKLLNQISFEEWYAHSFLPSTPGSDREHEV